MKKLSLIGFVLSVIVLIFGIYLILIVAPDADVAEAEMQLISLNNPTGSLFDMPGYNTAFETMEKKVDYGMVLLFSSILTFLLCIVPVFKKNILAITGLLFSLIAFFIGAAYGSHMFS